MDRVELTDLAEQFVEAHRDTLLLDPFIKISVEILDGSFASQCFKDTTPLSWIIRLNPTRHEDLYEVQYSVLESLLVILFDDLNLAETLEVRQEIQQRIVSRLTSAFCSIFEDDNSEEDLEEEIDEEV